MFDTLNSVEDSMADSISPIYSKIGFWQSRIKIILIELISKDLIKMGNVRFPDDLADQNYTASSVYAAPLEIREHGNRRLYVKTYDNDGQQVYSGDRWIHHQADQPPQQIPINVFDGIAFLEYYEIVIVNPNLIYDTGEMFSAKGVLPEDLSSDQADEYERHIEPNSWADIKRDGAVRYVNWDFNMIRNENDDRLSTYSNYYVGLPDAAATRCDVNNRTVRRIFNRGQVL